VKISPDMVDQDMVDVLEVSIEQKLAGVIATNTTISRPEGLASITGAEKETGGLSGQPLTQRANEVMRFLYRESGGRIPLVGVGGIASAEDAYHRIRAGASLVQIYTGLIYEGPYLPRRVNRGLLALLKQDGLRSISEAVGVDA
jgi:dihydroorotate dehydrogenase